MEDKTNQLDYLEAIHRKLIDNSVTQADIQHFEETKPLGLNYSSFFHSLDANNAISFEGENVLEIGGALPPAWVFNFLHPKAWTATETVDYESLIPGGNQRGKWDQDLTTTVQYHYHLNDINSFLEEYAVKVEQGVCTKFTKVYSVAAFEHISHLALMFKNLDNVCEPGALLYTYFTPIWSAPQGHHFDFQFNFPDYWHLAHTPQTALDILLSNGIDPHQSEDIVFNMYKNTHINRLMPSDYKKIFSTPSWSIQSLLEINSMPITKLNLSLKKLIQKYHPSEDLLCSGYRVTMQKN